MTQPSYVVVQVGKMNLTAIVSASNAREVQLKARFPDVAKGSEVRMLIGDDEHSLIVVDHRGGVLRTRRKT